MNRERAKELLPIIEAFANGEDIEINHSSDGWRIIDEPGWSSDPKKYRIKPKAREFWIDTVATSGSHLEAFEYEPCMTDNWPYIKVREVL